MGCKFGDLFGRFCPVQAGEQLRDSERIDVFLNSNLVNVRLEEGTGRVSELQCANYANPETRRAFTGKI